MSYIKKEGLVVGQAYTCYARNFCEGTWNGKEFEYTREKFGQKYTDTELHYDDGPPHGTVRPISEYYGEEVVYR